MNMAVTQNRGVFGRNGRIGDGGFLGLPFNLGGMIRARSATMMSIAGLVLALGMMPRHDGFRAAPPQGYHAAAGFRSKRGKRKPSHFANTGRSRRRH